MPRGNGGKRQNGGAANVSQNDPTGSAGGGDDGSDEEMDGPPPFDEEDPAQRAENLRKRREIRCQYRTLIDKTQENSHDLIKGDTAGLSATLQSAEEIFEKVSNPREAVLDSHLMAVVANLARQKAQAFNTNLVTFEPIEYAIKIMSFISDDQPLQEDSAISVQGWEKLGEAVQPFFKRAPPLQLMLGSFSRQPPEKKSERKPRQKDTDLNTKKTVPEHLKSFKEDNREATTEQVEKILTYLKDYIKQNNGDPLCYFEFIINPESFSQTIENMFYASFLIKDGFAKIMLDEDGLPLIAPTDNSAEEQAENQKKKQVIMSMTQKEYRDIIAAFGITDPLIPTR